MQETNKQMIITLANFIGQITSDSKQARLVIHHASNAIKSLNNLTIKIEKLLGE